MEEANTLPKLPKWAKKPLDNCLDYLDNLSLMTELSTKSIQATRMMPELFNILKKHLFASDPQSFTDADKSAFEKISTMADKLGETAAIAEREDIKGFPLLNGMWLVLTWGALETYITELLKVWLENVPESWNLDEVQNLRIKLGEYMRIEDELRNEYVIEQIDKTLNGPLKQGIGRFEVLLNVFHLSGSIDDDIRERLYLMCKIRNVFVHNRGIADKKFVESCPALECKIGDIVISKDFNVTPYIHAVGVYIAEIQLRIFEALGFSRDKLAKSPVMNVRLTKFEEVKKIIELEIGMTNSTP